MNVRTPSFAPRALFPRLRSGKIVLLAAALFMVAPSLTPAPCPAAAVAPSKPNIVVIVSDDFGYGSAGCYGADPALIRTPNLDRLAAEGRRFTDANTTSSVCSPTRYSVLTGRYCWRTSLKSGVLSTYSPLHIETTRLNMASLLKKHGYATAAVGKWHLGYGTATDAPNWRVDYTTELSPGPLDIGFDYHFSVPANHGDLTGAYVENRYVYGLRSGKILSGAFVAAPDPKDAADYQATYSADDTESGKATIIDLDAPRRKNDRVMHVLTQKSIDWIEKNAKQGPFFLYYTPVAVHNPITPSAETAGTSKAGVYGDFIHELDLSVGKILEALDRTGTADNTLVLFTSDNGGVYKPELKRDTPQTRAVAAGLKPNGALRGGKHHVWEGGFKVPFLVRWPGRAPANSVCSDMVSLADILATTAAIVGEPLPPADAAAEDSRNFLPALLGEKNEAARGDMIVHSSDGVFALRRGPWKWIEGVPVSGLKAASLKLNASQFKPQLYNTADDPAETTDVASAHPEIAAELQALLVRYRDGGYSRELPPPGTKKMPRVAVLPALESEVVVDFGPAPVAAKSLQTTGEKWTTADGAYFATQPRGAKSPAGLRIDLPLTDAVIQYEINFRGAGRHSLRIDCQEQGTSFRCEISASQCGITKNPPRGAEKSATEPLARKSLELERDGWYPVRVTLRGDTATLQVNDTVLVGKNAVIAEPKRAANLLMFGEDLGVRNIVIAK